MKKGLAFLTVLMVSLMLFSTSNANLIQNPGFEAFPTLPTTNQMFMSSDFLVANTNTWGKWLDLANFRSVVGSTVAGIPTGWTGNNFAMQNPTFNSQTNTTELLMQGWAGSLTPSGSVLQIDFDYIYTAGHPTNMKLVGFTSPTGFWDNNAPWNVTGGEVIQTWALTSTTGWDLDNLYTVALTKQYYALALGFVFGGYTTGYRGLDNVSVEVAPAVPEPATMLLLGSGLAGLGLLGRRRFKK